MAIDEKLLKSVIAEVLKEMNTADTSAASAVEGETYECPGMQKLRKYLQYSFL